MAQAPEPHPAPPAVPPLPEGCCVLQIYRPADGFTLRVWDDGRWTEARSDRPEEVRAPFDPTLQYDPVRERFVAEQKAAWAEALSTAGLDRGTLHFSTRVDGQTRGRWVEGTLPDAASLAPLTEAWLALRARLYAPRR